MQAMWKGGWKHGSTCGRNAGPGGRGERRADRE